MAQPVPKTIRAYYDGEVLIPEGAVDLPVGESICLQVVENVVTRPEKGTPASEGSSGKSDLLPKPSLTREERLRAAKEFAGSLKVAPLPDEAYDREGIYPDRG